MRDLPPGRATSEPAIERPEGDRQNAGPGERGEEAVQDPRPEPDQGDRQHDPRDTPRESQALGLDTIGRVRRIGGMVHRTTTLPGIRARSAGTII